MFERIGYAIDNLIEKVCAMTHEKYSERAYLLAERQGMKEG